MARVKQCSDRDGTGSKCTAPSSCRDDGPSVGISLPFVEDLDGGMIHSVEVPLFYAEQRAGLCRLRRALESSGCKLRNGNPVKSHPDAIRYVLEQYEAGVDESVGT